MGYQLLHVYTWGLLYLYLYSQVIPRTSIQGCGTHKSHAFCIYIYNMCMSSWGLEDDEDMGKEYTSFKMNTSYGCSTLIAIGLILAAFVGSIFYWCKYNDTVWLVVFVSIANALLLFATLIFYFKAHINERETSEKERFESNFFNLLQYHQQLIGKIKVERHNLQKDISKIIVDRVFGNGFFFFALNEIRDIVSVLEQEMLPSYYNQEGAKATEQYLESQKGKLSYSEYENEVNRLKPDFYLGLVVSTYAITTEDHEEYQHNHNNNIPFEIFERKWHHAYNHYIHSICGILKQILDRGGDIRNYTRIIYSQMSDEEFYFLLKYATSHQEMMTLMKETGLLGMSM